jgi:ATP-binding cassette subfamily F protein uup
MNYLQLENISKSYGDLELFNDISFTVNKGDKVALIAKNGAGKTSLLHIVTGKDIADSGDILISKDIEIGYLEQTPKFDDNKTVLEAVFDSSKKIVSAIKAYNQALKQENQQKLDVAIETMNRLNAWDYENTIKQILSRLKITEFDKEISLLSGGEKKRIALAHALINEADLLILDEPTNHLDLEMIEWLEEYLKKTKLSLLMVTHDRYFLDRVCNTIIEIDNKSLYKYKGNYSYFIEKRKERIENLKANIEKAKNLYRKELDWMRRMPQARATKAKARIDSFYETKEKAGIKLDDRSLDIQIKASRLGKKILELYNVHHSFGTIKIVDDFSYLFKRNEKIGIIGKNGSGKSSFLNIITGEIKQDKGRIERGESLQIAYYKQEGIQFDEDKRVIEVIKDIAESIQLNKNSTMSAAAFLRYWLFPDSMHYNLVATLSGGEKRRLYLMTVLMTKPNFLILDEPTNDLDIMTINVLEDYLRGFEGCLLVVSHDRYFMDEVLEHVFVFEGDGKIKDFPGTYTQYNDYLNIKKREEKQKAIKKEKPKPKPKEKTQKLSYKEQKELETLDEEIPKLEGEKAVLEQEMSSGLLEQEELFKKSNRIAEIMEIIDQKTLRWMELSEIAEQG